MREPGFLRDHENKIITNKHGHQLLDDGWDYVVDDYGNVVVDEYGVRCMTPESRSGLGRMWREVKGTRAAREAERENHPSICLSCSLCDSGIGFDPEEEGF